MVSFANSRPCICQPENFKLSMWWHGLSQHLDGKKNHMRWCFCHKWFSTLWCQATLNLRAYPEVTLDLEETVFHPFKVWTSKVHKILGMGRIAASGVASANAHMAAMWAFSANLAIWSCSACRVMANLTPKVPLVTFSTQETRVVMKHFFATAAMLLCQIHLHLDECLASLSDSSWMAHDQPNIW